MQAFTIKTNKSDYPFLVIADGFKSAVEVLYQKGIYDTDIISVQQMETVKSSHILIEERLTDREVLREEVRRERGYAEMDTRACWSGRRCRPRHLPGKDVKGTLLHVIVHRRQ